MGLVAYSDSESESETVQSKPTVPATSAAPKKAFQKLLDRSSGAGKIVVNLPAASATVDANPEDEQPPAKRAKTAGGSRFSRLGSFLPPPKKAGAAAPAAAGGSKQGTAPAPGIHLRTGAEPAFIRGGDDAGPTEDGDTATSSLNLPPPSSRSGPSIPEGQKPEEEVKLVGKPLMFKPLSVARKKAPAKKKKDLPPGATSRSPSLPAPQNGPTATAAVASTPAEPPPKKKISLFSMGDDDTPTTSTAVPTDTYSYEPLFTTASEPTDTGATHDNLDGETAITSAYPTTTTESYPPTQTQNQNPLSALADNLDLTPAARRELFGRTPSSSSSANIPANAKIINFNMEREYAHNEALRASGAQQAHNPVRSIAPGKHSLRQVVNMAQSNQGALEESFARAKGSKRDAAGRYGWS